VSTASTAPNRPAGGEASAARSVAVGLARPQSVAWLPDAVRGAVPLAMLLALVLAVWAPGVRDRGLNYETGFPYSSQTGTLLGPFLYGDELRPFTSVFYHLSYLLSLAAGGAGDYIYYQYVYAALWFGRALLFYLLMRAVLPAYPLAAYVASGLMMVHASDGALNWVGQLNQFGFMFWLILAALLFVSSIRTSRPMLGCLLLAGAMVSECLCLWSYESPLPLILALPLILGWALRAQPRLVLVASVGWYTVPALYLWQTFHRYFSGRGSGYQESVLRPDLSIVNMLHDWLLQVRQSISFWSWQEGTPWFVDQPAVNLVALIAAALFVMGGFLVIRSEPRRPAVPRVTHLASMLGVGAIILVLSFPVYLLLAGNTHFWRTQMLSGFGAALTLAACALLVGRVARRPHIGASLTIVLAGVVVFFGVRASERVAGFHARGWERHRAIMWQVVNLVPDVNDDALIMLVGLPKSNDPFGDAMWFDFPVRLSYPRHTTAGAIAYSDPGPTDRRWDFDDSGVRWNQVGYPPPVPLRTVGYERLVLLGYDDGGGLSVLDHVPDWLLGDSRVDARYDPSRLIVPESVTDINRRRFGQ
jgi:hypothetical protein